MKKDVKDTGALQLSNSIGKDNHVTGVEVEDVVWNVKDDKYTMEASAGITQNN